MTVVDVHAHLMPAGFLARAPRDHGQGGISVRDGDDRVELVFRGPTLGATAESVYPQRPIAYDIDARLDAMDRLGVDVQILSLNPLLFNFGLDAAQAAEHACAINDEMASIQGAHPERFRALATLPLQDPEASARELERAVRDLGLVGAQIGANVWGRDLDDPSLVEVFETAAELGAVVFVHPSVMQSHPSVANMQRLGPHFLRNLIGNPLDTTIAIARLHFSGLLERLPGLKMYFAHAGGYALFALGRFRHGHHVRREITGPDPAALAGRIYVDTLALDPRALRYVVDVAGADRVMLGSDFPTNMGPSDPVASIDEAELGDETRTRILGGNAARLFGLS